jgi:ubiquinone/menaquinone biosynthesis C-methylase UbiE
MVASADLKEQVRDHWNSEPCGTRYLGTSDDFEAHAKARYTLETYIPGFAQFAASKGQKVLEVGVGLGADYLEFLKAGALATGVDLTASSIEKARRRCEMAGYTPDLKVADAESLPFPDDTFDVVYSYGAMHHSPTPERCIAEARRVLKPGGQFRMMVYHHPSLTGLMLWTRFGLGKGKSIRQTVYEQLESPGTKSYTKPEAHQLMKNFEEVAIDQVYSPGDLLLHKASSRYQGGFYKLVWALYPRTLVRLTCRRLGLFILITGRKPVN